LWHGCDVAFVDAVRYAVPVEMRKPSGLEREQADGCSRRVSPIASGRSDGPLSDHRAGGQPAQRELVFMPHSGPLICGIGASLDHLDHFVGFSKMAG
jgi:hypothetical protein